MKLEEKHCLQNSKKSLNTGRTFPAQMQQKWSQACLVWTCPGLPHTTTVLTMKHKDGSVLIWGLNSVNATWEMTFTVQICTMNASLQLAMQVQILLSPSLKMFFVGGDELFMSPHRFA